jgi:hypothetical protein
MQFEEEKKNNPSRTLRYGEDYFLNSDKEMRQNRSLLIKKPPNDQDSYVIFVQILIIERFEGRRALQLMTQLVNSITNLK